MSLLSWYSGQGCYQQGAEIGSTFCSHFSRESVSESRWAFIRWGQYTVCAVKKNVIEKDNQSEDTKQVMHFNSSSDSSTRTSTSARSHSQPLFMNCRWEWKGNPHCLLKTNLGWICAQKPPSLPRKATKKFFPRGRWCVFPSKRTWYDLCNLSGGRPLDFTKPSWWDEIRQKVWAATKNVFGPVLDPERFHDQRRKKGKQQLELELVCSSRGKMRETETEKPREKKDQEQTETEAEMTQLPANSPHHQPKNIFSLFPGRFSFSVFVQRLHLSAAFSNHSKRVGGWLGGCLDGWFGEILPFWHSCLSWKYCSEKRGEQEFQFTLKDHQTFTTTIPNWGIQKFHSSALSLLVKSKEAVRAHVYARGLRSQAKRGQFESQ